MSTPMTSNSDTPLEPDRRKLLIPLQAMATAETRDVLRSILSQYPDLLSSWADGILTQLVQAAWQRQQMDSLCIFTACRAFLTQCRQIGSEDALAEQQTFPVPASSPLAKLLQLPKDDSSIPHRIPIYRHAINQVRRETERELWATLQYELADCLARSQEQDRAQNLEEALQRYQAALEVWTQDNSPEKWAQVSHDIGSAFRFRVNGDREENLKRAIGLYELALQVRTHEASPNGWAATQICLGIAWKDSPGGNHRENQERALKHYQAALKVWSRKANPVGWARVQHNMGNLCSQFVGDDRVTNLERAIKHYRLALKIRTRDAHPVAWAMTQVAMANAYVERIRGDRADNLERAIKLYEKALEVRTRKTRPAEWAETQYDLAVAYRMRIRGNRAENQEKAIEQYCLALEVHTRQAFPEQWATALTDLGLVYYRRLRGDRAENLERAVELFKQALEARKRDTLPEQWATTQLCLANAYCDRVQGNRAENLERAIEHYNLALEVRTREAFPYEWAMIRNNLSTAYWERIKGHRAQNIERAIQLFNEALEVHTPDAFPVDARRAARNLGNLYFEEHRWQEAAALYQRGLEAAENLYQASLLRSSKEAELAETADLYRRAAYASARSGDLQNAVVALERGRARLLSEALERDRADLETLKRTHPDLYERYHGVASDIAVLESRELRPGVLPTGLDLAGEMRAAREKLDRAVEAIRQVTGYENFLAEPGWDDVVAAMLPSPTCGRGDGDQGIPLVYLLTTSAGSLALVLYPTSGGGTAEVVWANGFTTEDLNALLVKHDGENVFGGYLPGQLFVTQWLEESLAEALPLLGERLVAPVAARLRKRGASGAVLIPAGHLGLLPLHAASTWPTRPVLAR